MAAVGWRRIGSLCLLVLVACGGRLESTSPNGNATNEPDSGSPSSNPSSPSLDDPGRVPFGCGAASPATAPTLLLHYNGGNDLALDASYLYLTGGTDQTVKRMPRGGGPLETFASGAFFAYQIHVHDTRVCWFSIEPHGDGNTYTVWCSSTTSAAAARVVDTGIVSGAFSFDFDDHAIYYAYPPSIYRAPLDGSTSPEVMATDVAPQQPYSPMSVRAQNGFLYWASVTDDGQGSIRRCATSGTCTPEILATYPSQSGDSSNITKIQFVAASTQVATTSTHVYWTASVDFHGDVYRMPLEGGAMTHLASCDDMFPQNLSVDANDVYWAATTAEYVENVWRLPLDGRPAAGVATMTIGQIWPNIFALLGTGDGAFYTTVDYTDASLWKIASP